MTQMPKDTPPSVDELLDVAFAITYDRTSIYGILKSLDPAGDPAANLAKTVRLVVMAVADSVQKSGRQIILNALRLATAKVAEDLADLTSRTWRHRYSDDEIRESASTAFSDVLIEMRCSHASIDIDAPKATTGERLDVSGLRELIPGADQHGSARRQPPADQSPA